VYDMMGPEEGGDGRQPSQQEAAEVGHSIMLRGCRGGSNTDARKKAGRRCPIQGDGCGWTGSPLDLLLANILLSSYMNCVPHTHTRAP